MPAHDYVLKCSHTFNVLDARGAIGVTERARYFVRMRDLSRQVAQLMSRQREAMGYPLRGAFQCPRQSGPQCQIEEPKGEGALDFLFEIGVEELPVGDLDNAIDQLRSGLELGLAAARLAPSSDRPGHAPAVSRTREGAGCPPAGHGAGVSRARREHCV